MTPLDSIKHYKSFFRSGFMVMQPQTGYIKAYVGGPDYRYFMYDMVSAGKRQVGSTIKPILYTLAMQEGLGLVIKCRIFPKPLSFRQVNPGRHGRYETSGRNGYFTLGIGQFGE